MYDPYVDEEAVYSEYGISVIKELAPSDYDAAIVTVGHDAFKELGAAGVRRFLKSGSIIFDVKAIYPQRDVDLRL